MNLSHYPQTPHPELIAAQAKLVADFPVLRFMNWQQTNYASWDNRPLIKTWDDLPKYNESWQYTTGPWGEFRGVPLELLVDFVNYTGQRGWFCIPHSAEAPLITRMVEWLIEKCDKRPILEFSNELWNNTFEQHKYAVQQGEGMGKYPIECALGWQAQQTFLMAEAAQGEADIVAGSQFFNYNNAKMLLKRCGDVVDALAVAPYPGRMQRAITEDGEKKPIDQIRAELQDEINDEVVPLFGDYNKLCNEYGIKLFAYEGGLHQVARNDGTPERLQAEKEQFCEFNRSEEAGEMTGYMWSMWQLLGGEVACPYSLATVFKSKWDGKLQNTFFGHCELVDKEFKVLPKYEGAHTVLTNTIEENFGFIVRSDDDKDDEAFYGE